MRTGDGDSTEEIDQLFEEEDVPFDDSPPPRRRRPSDAELESLYDTETFRIVTQRNDFLIPSLLQSMEQQHYLNLTPPYQRRLRWDNKRKSRLIESLLMNVPIPPIFLFETELAQYEVVDGQQRLATIREFFDNEFVLSGLERWEDLNGRRFNRLPHRIQSGLRRRSLPAVILLAESGRSAHEDQEDTQRAIKRFVFERLNTGGVRLNAQEIRNAVYDGPFNHLLHDLSRDPLFTLIWDIPPREKREDTRASQQLRRNRFYRQMLDCEIVLRFFTLSDPARLATSMKTSLDNTMDRYAPSSPEDLDTLRADFMDCLRTAHDIYGHATFRLLPETRPRGRPRRRLSRPLYDAVMLGIFNTIRAKTGDSRADAQQGLKDAASLIVAQTESALDDPANYELLVGRPNTRTSILQRIDLLTTICAHALESLA